VYRMWKTVLGVGLLWAQGPLWQTQVDRQARLELGEDGNLLVMSGKEGIWALSGETGQVIWRCSACDRVPPESWRRLGQTPLWEGGSLSLPSQVEGATGSFQNLQAAFQPYLILNPYTGRLVYDAEQMRRRMTRTLGRAVVPAVRVRYSPRLGAVQRSLPSCHSQSAQSTAAPGSVIATRGLYSSARAQSPCKA